MIATIFAVMPQFEANPALKISVQGENVTLTCNVSAGIPPPNVTWTFRGRAVTSYSILGDLELYNVQKTEHEGMYTCLAKNDAGKIERRVHLTVDGMS